MLPNEADEVRVLPKLTAINEIGSVMTDGWNDDDTATAVDIFNIPQPNMPQLCINFGWMIQ